MGPNEPPAGAAESKAGVIATTAAFLMWGLLPGYWRALGALDAREILAHRVVWSLALTAALLAVGRRWAQVRAACRSARDIALLIAAALLLGANWLTYVYGVITDRLVECSLGYFITPLASVMLGRLCLGERLRPRQTAAVGLAGAAVAAELVWRGRLPWIALALAGTFSLYALLRKTSRLASLPGLAAQTAVLFAPAAAYLVVLAVRGTGALGRASAATHLLLVGTGAATAVPLLAFAFGARRIQLSTTGFLQYLAPTCAFLLAVFCFGEPLDPARLLTCAAVWAALAIYTWDGLRAARPAQRGVA